MNNALLEAIYNKYRLPYNLSGQTISMGYTAHGLVVTMYPQCEMIGWIVVVDNLLVFHDASLHEYTGISLCDTELEQKLEEAINYTCMKANMR